MKDPLPRSAPVLHFMIDETDTLLAWWRKQARTAKELDSPMYQWMLAVLEDQRARLIQQLEDLERSPAQGEGR